MHGVYDMRTRWVQLMAKYRMTKDMNAEKFDGTMESCVRILEMIGFSADEFSIHIYGNRGKKVVFDHKRREIEFEMTERDYIVLEDTGEWGIKWHGTFEEDYTEVCN